MKRLLRCNQIPPQQILRIAILKGGLGMRFIICFFLTISWTITSHSGQGITIETVRIDEAEIIIPVPSNFQKRPLSQTSYVIPGAGEVKAHFEYAKMIGFGKGAIVTSMAVTSIPQYNSHSLSNQDFADLKAASRVQMKFQKEQLTALLKDHFDPRGKIMDIGEYAEGVDFQASYGFSRLMYQESPYYQYGANVLMLVKGKIICLAYTIMTEALDERYAEDARAEALAWKDVILTENTPKSQNPLSSMSEIIMNHKGFSIPTPPEMRKIPNKPAQDIEVLYQAALIYDIKKLESEKVEIHPAYLSIVCDVSQPEWSQNKHVSQPQFESFKKKVRDYLVEPHVMTNNAGDLVSNTTLHDYIFTISESGPFAESDHAIYTTKKTIGKRGNANPDYYHIHKEALVCLKNTLFMVRVRQKGVKSIPEVEEKKLERALVAWVDAIQKKNSATSAPISSARLPTISGWERKKALPMYGAHVLIPIPNDYEIIKSENPKILVEFVSRDLGLDKMRSGLVNDFPYHQYKGRAGATVGKEEFAALKKTMFEMANESGQVILLLNAASGGVGEPIKIDEGKYIFRSKTFVFVKDRIIWLQTDSADSPENRKWTERFIDEWVTAILAANK